MNSKLKAPINGIKKTGFGFGGSLFPLYSLGLFRMTSLFFGMSILLFLSGCGVPSSYGPTQIIGSQGKKPGQFFGLAGISLLNSSGDIVTLEGFTKRVQILNSSGKPLSTIAEKPGNELLKLSGPVAIAVNQNGSEIAIVDNKAGKIFIYYKDGALKSVLKDLARPNGCAFDEKGDLYLIALRKSDISVYDIQGVGGKLKKTIAGKGKSILNGPTFICIANSRIHVIEDSARRVSIFNMAGEPLFQITDKGGYGDFLSPKGLYVDSQGSIYVADTGEIPCVKFDSEGKFVSRIGSYGKKPGELMSPAGLTLLPDGQILIADGYLNQIQGFKLSP